MIDICICPKCGNKMKSVIHKTYSDYVFDFECNCGYSTLNNHNVEFTDKTTINSQYGDKFYEVNNV